jgi:murein L,D-transpeptidase YcbB/YkuD
VKKDEKKVSTTSATGQAILLRQQQLAAEEERIKKLQEEEDRKIKEEQEREEAERKAIEDEKERKRKEKAKKIEQQKAAGTYMTKAEKERHKKAVARLESMKAAGMVPTTSTLHGNNNDKEKNLEKRLPSETNRKDYGNNFVSSIAEEEKKIISGDDLAGNEINDSNPVTEKIVEEESLDDWDAGGEDDSWLNNALGVIAAKAEQLTALSNADEDTLETERRLDQERLRILGIERAKRDEENRIKRYIKCI